MLYRVHGTIFLKKHVRSFIAPYVSLVIEAPSLEEADNIAKDMHEPRHKYRHLRTEEIC